MTLISTLNILEYKTKMMGKKDGAYPKSIGLQVILMLVCLIYIVWNKYLKKGINYVDYLQLDIFVCFSISFILIWAYCQSIPQTSLISDR